MAERDSDDPRRPDQPDPDQDEPEGSGALPHPLDRVWAHPSELGAVTASAPPTPRPGTLRPGTPRPGWSALGVALAGALCGAIVTLGVVLATGGFDDGASETRAAFVPAFPELGVDRTAGLVATISPSVVAVRAIGGEAGEDRFGTGVVLGGDRILTNAFLVVRGGTITVTTSDGSVVPAELLGGDPATDLAVLKADGAGAPGARMGSADGVGVGTWVLAVGASASQRRWANEGIVSGLDMVLGDPAGRVLAGMLGTDLEDGAGDGGGILLDETGAVVAILSGSVPGHAVPIDAARTVADQLTTAGHAAHGWLGTYAVDETERDGGGARVQAVAAAGPGEAAGLAVGDVVTAIGGRRVTDVGELASAISRLRPGDPVELTVLRDGRRRRIDASLGERPADAIGLAALQM
ncbi:MAG: PDZ domain-containing protein [Acidimicrobiia bacterium]